MNVSEQGLAINRRFFLALDMLRQKRILRGKKTFATKHGINPWNIFMAQREPEKHFINVEWLSFLVTDYGISAEYLLTGVGNVFKDSKLNVGTSDKGI